MKRELVKNWMSREVITVTPDTSLTKLHRLMTDYKIRRIPVIKKGRLAGIVTLGDIREAEPTGATSLSIWEINYLIAKLQAKDIMTRNPVTISPEATVGEAAKLMLQHKVSGLPVVDEDNRVIGIITESDIFRMVVEAWSKKEPDPVVLMAMR